MISSITLGNLLIIALQDFCHLNMDKSGFTFKDNFWTNAK